MKKEKIKKAYIKQAFNDFTFWTLVVFVVMCGAGIYYLIGTPISCSREFLAVGIGDCNSDLQRENILGSILILGGLFVLSLSIHRLRILFLNYKSTISQQGK